MFLKSQELQAQMIVQPRRADLEGRGKLAELRGHPSSRAAASACRAQHHVELGADLLKLLVRQLEPVRRRLAQRGHRASPRLATSQQNVPAHTGAEWISPGGPCPLEKAPSSKVSAGQFSPEAFLI